MVLAVNCGADGSPNSFTNFKNAALAVGASLAAEASSTSDAGGYGAPASSTVASTPVTTTDAASSASTAAAATHTVVVGGNSSLTFTPSELQAQPNDVVVFQL